jgi:hypothetical protein
MSSMPAMVVPSAASTAAFVAIVLGLAALFVAGVAFAGRASGESTADTRRWTVRAAIGIAVWLGLTGALSASGVLARPMLPPPLALFMLASMAVSVRAAFSPLGTRLVRGVPIAALVAVQGFRLPLELVLHAWKDQGVIPVQLTFEGHNFDVASGLLALIVGAWLARGKAEKAPNAARAGIWAFNLVGFALLIAVTSIAILSSPLPIRVYLNDPPVLLAFYFPYGWIVPICVGGALFGHLLTFRWLAASRHTAVEIDAAFPTFERRREAPPRHY